MTTSPNPVPENPPPAHQAHRTLGYFITRVVRHLPDGRRLLFSSRRQRKGLPPIPLGAGARRGAGRPSPWLRLWAPHRLAWWIAVLFMIGSACFAVASFAANWPARAPTWLSAPGIINRVFFTGSLFFTSAAWLQLLEAINGDVAELAGHGPRPHWRWFAWRPRNLGYLASLIQFAGTLLFNVNTWDAMLPGLSWRQEDLLIWTPDIIGSVCFLLASYLAVIEVSHHFWSVKPRQLSWWVVILNLLGSIAFMRAALAGFYPPAGSELWAWGANTYTLAGALCFLVASYLMIPELFGAGQAAGDTPGAPEPGAA